jgi:hypothetical protein
MYTTLKIHGIAGGVGATVLATILGAEEVDDRHQADIVVARNDYRCARALVTDSTFGGVVVLVEEFGRALTADDFRLILPTHSIVAVTADMAIARADDAGLLDVARPAVRRYVTQVRQAVAA